MVSEFLLFIGVIIIGSVPLVTGVLYLIFGNNLTVRLWIGLLPGIVIVITNTYIWARLGGLTNLYLTITVVPAGVLLMIVNFLIVGKTLIQKINRTVNIMNEVANHVFVISSQMSTSSQQLAEASSEQAASIEETSSSLEEMASMTKQNAGNATEARNMMAEAKVVVEKVDRHMAEMGDAINEITKSSEETSKIIKTIDEISFQTNLLALNAAVEAARAGEAGAGFAVVADEVRYLALRAAEAAKNTSNLIENTIESVRNGNKLTQSTQATYKESMEIAAKVSQLVDEIAAASGEQAQGIDQINIAVSEMDKVIQRNATNAEESAVASEEMNSQAEYMRTSVHELMTMVNGTGNGNGREESPSIPSVSHTIRHTHPDQKTETRKMGVYDEKLQCRHKAGELNPENVIPMNDDGFEDF